MNPYEPPQGPTALPEPALSLRASCWKFAQISAITAFAGLSGIGILFVGLILIRAGLGLETNWKKELFAIGSWIAATAVITLICAGAGSLIGAAFYFLRRAPNGEK